MKKILLAIILLIGFTIPATSVETSTTKYETAKFEKVHYQTRNIKVWRAKVIGFDSYSNMLYGYSYQYRTRSQAIARARRECSALGGRYRQRIVHVQSYWVSIPVNHYH